MPFKLSVAIITYNEEKNLKRCLESINGLWNELIIVDSGSVDGTKTIAEAYGAKFIHHDFEGHIQQKNFALDQCQYDMVLSLDADEVLSADLKSKVQELKQKKDRGFFVFNRMTNYRGHWIKHSGWYPDKKLRLFDRNQAKWGGKNPHDIVEVDPEIKVEKINLDILHYSFPDLGSHIKQIDFFTRIMAKEMVERGKRPSLFKELFSPAFKFFQSYFLQLGFLDGYAGFQVCRISAFATYMKYSRLREYYQNPDLD